MRPPSVEENREKNGHFDEDELRRYKEAWSENFGPAPEVPEACRMSFLTQNHERKSGSPKVQGYGLRCTIKEKRNDMKIYRGREIETEQLDTTENGSRAHRMPMA